MSTNFGLIAEDESDIKVLKILMQKLICENSFCTKKFSANGCGKIMGKAIAWANTLRKKGCHRLILVHDLDRHNEVELRRSLEEKLNQSDFSIFCVVVPKEEIEAWLLCDNVNLGRVLNSTQPFPEILHPEEIKSPKEFLRRKSNELGGRRYVNSIDNPKIAEGISIGNLDRCPSFTNFSEFVLQGVPRTARI